MVQELKGAGRRLASRKWLPKLRPFSTDVSPHVTRATKEIRHGLCSQETNQSGLSCPQSRNDGKSSKMAKNLHDKVSLIFWQECEGPNLII